MGVHFPHPIKELRLLSEQQEEGGAGAKPQGGWGLPQTYKPKRFTPYFSSLAISRIHEYYLVLAAPRWGQRRVQIPG